MPTKRRGIVGATKLNVVNKLQKRMASNPFAFAFFGLKIFQASLIQYHIRIGYTTCEPSNGARVKSTSPNM